MNSKIVNSIMAVVIAGLSFSCQSKKFEVHEDGYQYMFIHKGEGELPEEGDIVSYNMTYKNEKDSVLFQSTADRPAMVPCNMQQWDNMGPLYKAFKIIRGGDSVLIKIPTKTLFAESFKVPMPPEFDAEGEITFCIGVSKIMNEAEAQAETQKMREKQQAEMLAASAEQMEKDIEIIEEYLKENNITAQSTESGLRYVIETEGTGSYPQPGENVKVHYAGTLLDGTKFDSSYDHDPSEPLSFAIGRRQVIQGWDEGIALLKPGGKGMLYIPSSLAYGPREAGAIIKPNSVLKFEVELVEIE